MRSAAPAFAQAAGVILRDEHPFQKRVSVAQVDSAAVEERRVLLDDAVGEGQHRGAAAQADSPAVQGMVAADVDVAQRGGAVINQQSASGCVGVVAVHGAAGQGKGCAAGQVNRPAYGAGRIAQKAGGGDDGCAGLNGQPSAVLGQVAAQQDAGGGEGTGNRVQMDAAAGAGQRAVVEDLGVAQYGCSLLQVQPAAGAVVGDIGEEDHVFQGQRPQVEDAAAVLCGASIPYGETLQSQFSEDVEHAVCAVGGAGSGLYC